MDQDLQLIETILHYLEDTMTTAEREAFEVSLKADEALRKEVDYYRKAKQGFDGLKAETLLKNIDAWETEANNNITKVPDNVKDIHKDKVKSKHSIFPILGLAASIVAAFLLFWFMMHPNGILTPEEIIASYTPEHKMPLIRNANGTEHQLKVGIEAFKEQRYDDAANFFESIPVTGKQYIDAQMYLGYSRFESKQYGLAIAAFTIVKNAKSPRFSDKAEWFIAIAHLAAGNEDDWLFALKRIGKNNRHQYYGEAVEISGKLK